MVELSKRIYFGGQYAKRRWDNYRKLARLYFKGSVAALIRDAITQVYNLDPETGEPLDKNALDMVADKPKFKRKNGSTGVAFSKSEQHDE